MGRSATAMTRNLAFAAPAAFLLVSCSHQQSGQSGTDTAHAAGAPHQQSPRSGVPGGCSAPASENVGRAGCYMAAEIGIESPPAEIFWSAFTFPTAEAAAAAARRHRWSVTTHSHGLHWAHVLGPERVQLDGGRR